MPFCGSKKRINKQPGLELSSCSPEEPYERQHRIDSPKLRSSGRRIRTPNFRRTSAQAIRPGTAQSLRCCSHRTWRSMRHGLRSRSHCPLPARCGRNHFRLGSFSANVRAGPTIQLRHFLPGRKHDVPGPSQWNTCWESPRSMPSSTFPKNRCSRSFGKCKEYCNRAGCCCWHFIPATKSSTRMSCGVGLSQGFLPFSATRDPTLLGGCGICN